MKKILLTLIIIGSAFITGCHRDTTPTCNKCKCKALECSRSDKTCTCTETDCTQNGTCCE